jgi:hypothetical protein
MNDRRTVMVTYESPQITDYGTLVELTQAGASPNRDTPTGVNNTAYPPPS